MADSVIYELLPRFGKYDGGIRGVPGLRSRRRQGQLVLRDSFGPAHLIASRADGKPLHLPAPRDGETRLWKARGRLSREEKREAGEWGTSIPHIVDAPVRDVLLSRILRRPALVNRAAQPHGFANCYTHHEGDLVTLRYVQDAARHDAERGGDAAVVGPAHFGLAAMRLRARVVHP
jgi:hypothetical protein